MKKVFDIIIDIFATVFVEASMITVMGITYVVVLPIATILGSLMERKKMSESYLEFHKTFISRMNDL